MLQQTQAKTVIAYYLKWMERFGDWEKLANASEGEVLKAWEGLGYYARARNLHKIAAIVFFEKKGILLSEPTELLKLPGIGLYTANAIASLAFGKKTVALDANGIRVLVRLLSIHQPINKAGALKELSRIAMNLLSEDNDFSLFNSALMDFGRAVCKPLAPKCMICPLKEICQAEQPEQLPRRPGPRLLAASLLCFPAPFSFWMNRPLVWTRSLLSGSKTFCVRNKRKSRPSWRLLFDGRC